MTAKPKTYLLSPRERERVQPPTFEDFARTPLELSPPCEIPATFPPAPPEKGGASEQRSPHAPSPSSLTLAPEAQEHTDTEAWQHELQTAYERGFEDGKTAAVALYEAEFRRYHQWLQHFDELAHTLRIQVTQLSQEMEKAAVQLAFVIAEHVLGCELKQHPEQIEQLVQRALQSLPTGHALRIRLHPDTLEALQRASSRIATAHGEDISLIADLSVEPTGCVVESPWGVVDAQLSQQLQSIREQLQC
ncbi:MAG: FliH/SctL family protein [Candidatus Kapabacteria bacterium]|nr:FliH/SctL family protein [Candidatus Kapabacteria bacterium]MCS7169969.1 FliH/SctL family protein [Candidatus Kapabacteria bacterium]MDW7997544.1 FliH/SctL family protein [Bacteroidota bacterium]MDW8225286.1 FliH/SctL family protein [Bacteroidota bacterium]